MGKNKGVLSSGRLAIGIISIVLFVIICFQSCAAGISNTLEDNGELGGSAGFILSVCMLVSGIVGIVTRNSTSRTGAVITAVFYLVGALLAFANAGSYSDLIIWSVLAVIFAIVYIFCAVKTKKE